MLAKTLLLIFFHVLLFTGQTWAACTSDGQAEANTYYVKTGGNDGADGTTDANAWETIAKVTSDAISGDTICFRSQDTWTGADPVLNATAGVTYDGATYGTGTRATLQASSRVNGYGVVQIYVSTVTFKGFLVDSNELSIGGIYIGGTNPTPAGDISNIIVDNCEVTNGITTDNPDPAYYYGILIGARGSHTTSSVTVTNNIVHDVGHEGIPIYPNWGGAGGNRVNTALISGNTVYNTGQVGGLRGDPIDIANDSDNIIIEYNTIYGSSAGNVKVVNYGPGYTGPDEYPNNFIIRYNSINGSGFSTGGYIGFPHFYGDGAFYGNIVINGALGFGSADYHSVLIKIYNNTFYRNDDSFYAFFFNIDITNDDGIEVINNIFYTNNFAIVKDNDTSCDNSLTHTNNLYYRDSGSGDTHILCPWDVTFDRAEVTNWEATAQNTDPLFESISNLRLSSSSPAINTGSNAASIAAQIQFDFDRWPRISGATVDMGAFEYNTGNQNVDLTGTALSIDLTGSGVAFVVK